jgi:hypothetical protein
MRRWVEVWVKKTEWAGLWTWPKIFWPDLAEQSRYSGDGLCAASEIQAVLGQTTACRH